MGTYEWRFGGNQNFGDPSPQGYGTPHLATVVGAPGTTAQLKKIGLWFHYHVAGTAPSYTITPDWPWYQTGEAVAEVQAGGSTAVPDPADPTPVGIKVRAGLTQRVTSYGFSTSQAAVSNRTDGYVWSQGEDNSPGGAGLQVAVGFLMNDGSLGIGGFGSAFRWFWIARVAVLWYTP